MEEAARGRPTHTLQRSNDIDDLAALSPASLVPAPRARPLRVRDEVLLDGSVVDADMLLHALLVVVDERTQRVEQLRDRLRERRVRLGQRVRQRDQRREGSGLRVSALEFEYSYGNRKEGAIVALRHSSQHVGTYLEIGNLPAAASNLPAGCVTDVLEDGGGVAVVKRDGDEPVGQVGRHGVLTVGGGGVDGVRCTTQQLTGVDSTAGS